MIRHHAKNVLVTGGAGFIGANFIAYFLKQDPDVHIVNLDKLTYAGSLQNLTDVQDNNNYRFIHGDVSDSKLVNEIFMHYTIDTVIHFAAESHVDRSIVAPKDFMQTNVFGTFTLLEAARHGWRNNYEQCRFHHISTDEVYGSLQIADHPFSEKSNYQPNSPYSASKAAADHLVRAYHHTYGLPVTISNCSNNYGPKQHTEKFIPTVILACLQKKSIPIYGRGTNIRDWLFVEDHCQAIMKILCDGKNGESYNIGGENEWENLKLAEFICAQMDSIFTKQAPHAKLLQFIADRPGHDFRYAIDNKKIKSVLAWQPTVSMEQGIKKTIEFYLGQN